MFQKLLKMRKKSIVLAVSLLVLVCITVGGTLALLIDETSPVANIFTPTKVPPLVVEDIDGNIKKEVTIKNNGTTSAFIRAKVLVTWQDETGSVYGVAPIKNKDYQMEIPATTNWQLGEDEYYYYVYEVAAGRETTPLLKDGLFLTDTVNKPTGYQLHMEIITQTIQSEGTDSKGNKPIELAWGVDIENGELKAATITK